VYDRRDGTTQSVVHFCKVNGCVVHLNIPSHVDMFISEVDIHEDIKFTEKWVDG